MAVNAGMHSIVDTDVLLSALRVTAMRSPTKANTVPQVRWAHVCMCIRAPATELFLLLFGVELESGAASTTPCTCTARRTRTQRLRMGAHVPPINRRTAQLDAREHKVFDSISSYLKHALDNDSEKRHHHNTLDTRRAQLETLDKISFRQPCNKVQARLCTSTLSVRLRAA